MSLIGPGANLRNVQNEIVQQNNYEEFGPFTKAGLQIGANRIASIHGVSSNYTCDVLAVPLEDCIDNPLTECAVAEEVRCRAIGADNILFGDCEFG